MNNMAILSSSSHLMQLLDRTRTEIINGMQRDQSNRNNVPDENDDEVLDIIALTEDIQQWTMAERGNELRDCARYNDYIVLHTILYVTATTTTLRSNEVVQVDEDAPPPTFTNEKNSSIEDSMNTITFKPQNAADAVHQLLHSPDEHTGNTALHMAAANNHSNVVQFLLQIEQAVVNDIACCSNNNVVNDDTKPSSSTISQPERPALRLVQRTNTSGQNTPLHYAVTNRALESIRFLLLDYSNNDNESYTNPDIDVLQQNSAGRSSLTEAFALTSSSTSTESTTDQDTTESDDTKKNHDILTLLLEHPSANEERLIQSSQKHNTGENDVCASTPNANESDHIVALPPCHTHHFRLVGGGSSNTNQTDNTDNQGIELYIREMAMAPPTPVTNENDTTTPSTTISKTDTNDLIHILGGTEPMNDTTGYGIWSASIIMGQWMTDVFHNKHQMNGHGTPIQTILELGAGCGIPGITIAKSFLSRPESSILPTIYVTDLNPTTLRNLQHNVMSNHVDSITSVVSLDWNELIHCDTNDKIWPWMEPSATTESFVEVEHLIVDNKGIDILIGSDLVYQKEVVPILIQTIRKLRPQTFYYGAAGTNRDGHDIFIQSLQNEGRMTLVSSFPAPDIYRTTNPLYNQDDDECFIHFQDLLVLSAKNVGNEKYESDHGDDTFTLYEFSVVGN